MVDIRILILLNLSFLGEKCIEFDQMDRPTSASTTATLSRPSTATSTVNSQNVFMQARVRLGDDENEVEGSNPPTTNSVSSQEIPTETTGASSSIEGTNNQEVEGSNLTSTTQEKIDDASKKQPYKLEGSAPDIATKLEDVVDELPDHVLSR